MESAPLCGCGLVRWGCGPVNQGNSNDLFMKLKSFVGWLPYMESAPCYVGVVLLGGGVAMSSL